MMQSGAWAVAAVLVAAMAAGCSSSGEQPGAAQGANVPAPPNPAADTGGDHGKTSGGYAFGETYRGDIDTTIRKMEPFEFTTSDEAIIGDAIEPAGATAAWGVEFELTNNGDTPFPPFAFQISATTDGRKAAEVADPASGFEGMLSAPLIAPGQTVRFPIAYAGQGKQHVITVASLDLSKSATFSD